MSGAPSSRGVPAPSPVLRGSAQDERAPLLGIACCQDLPEREGLGPPLEEEFQAGHVLDGRFVVREAIGRSAMATIYRASDREAGDGNVALKVPLMSIESDPASFARFEREERIVAAMTSPGLLRLIPTHGQKSRPYFVTEYLDGCTLAFVNHRTRPIPEKDALRIVGALLRALGPMHEAGFAHLDLKPANVMICRDGTLCIIDFGLAAEIEPKGGFLSGLTPLIGTPQYMAPEQVRNKRCDARTDLYSVGVMLYEMMTGVITFPGEDPWASAHLKVTGDPVAPRALNPAISLEAEEIVLKAVRRDPDERYQDAPAFARDLAAPERVHVTGLSGRLQAPRWRLSLTGTPLLAGALIGVGFLAFLAFVFLAMLHHKGR